MSLSGIIEYVSKGITDGYQKEKEVTDAILYSRQEPPVTQHNCFSALGVLGQVAYNTSHPVKHFRAKRDIFSMLIKYVRQK